MKHAGTNQPAAGVTVRAKSERTMLRGSGVGKVGRFSEAIQKASVLAGLADK